MNLASYTWKSILMAGGKKTVLNKDKDLTSYELKEVPINTYDAKNFSYMKFLAFRLTQLKFSFRTCSLFEVFTDLFCRVALFQVDLTYGNILSIREDS